MTPCKTGGCKNNGQVSFGGHCYFHRDAGGIYRKYQVTRVDGSSEPGGKHERCDYFVLDWQHDPFAIPAALAYANACEEQFPALARDLRARAEQADRPVTCQGCGKEIDPDTCGCGDSRKGHGSPINTGHSFVPAGCDCFRHKAQP